MRVLITNKGLGFGDEAVLEDAQEYSKEYGGYIGYLDGVVTVVSTEDGAIILEDGDEDIESNL
jgi:hypothetical protein